VSFNLSDYETVASRLDRFWGDYPDGRIETELVNAVERFPVDGILFRAAVYRRCDDPHPTAVGYAHEFITERGVNSTSAVENCETSAIGRALANCSYAPKSARPSREEMLKVAQDNMREADNGSPPTEQERRVLWALLNELGMASDDRKPDRLTGYSKVVGREITSTKDLTGAEMRLVIKSLRFRRVVP
jgi:hypothetical protein